jgi:uncharacterized RDD family membrane protein YckC
MNTVSPNQPNPYAPPQADVGDVTDGDAQVELAGRGERLGAAILDSIISSVLVGVPLLIGMNWDAVARQDWMNAFTPLGLGVGIKVVRSDRSHASLGRIFWLRNVVNWIPSAIPYLGNIYGLVDALFIFSESRQCVHDKIADTIVVKA